MKNRFAILIAASTLAIAGAASADSVAFNNAAAPDSTPANTGLVAFKFTVTSPIQVTELGFYAQSIGGADQPHVALIDLGLTGVQTNPPTVLYDTGNLVGLTVDSTMNYFAVTGPAIILSPTHTYEVSAPIYFSQKYDNNVLKPFTFGPEIATHSFMQGQDFGAGNWDLDNGTVPPNYDYTQLVDGGASAFISANFKYTLAVPEPASLGLLVLGAMGLAARRRR